MDFFRLLLILLAASAILWSVSKVPEILKFWTDKKK